MSATTIDSNQKKIRPNSILLVLGFVLLIGLDFRVIKKGNKTEDKAKLKTQNYVVSFGKFILY